MGYGLFFATCIWMLGMLGMGVRLRRTWKSERRRGEEETRLIYWAKLAQQMVVNDRNKFIPNHQFRYKFEDPVKLTKTLQQNNLPIKPEPPRHP